jgi:hypothetical protein
MIVDKDFLTKEQKLWIENVLFAQESLDFKLSLSSAGGNSPHFVHHALHRETGEKSYLYEYMVDILKTFCDKNGITVSGLRRIAINLTFNSGGAYRCPRHRDHLNSDNYSQLILYLNDSSGDTVVYENGEAVIVNPEKYKGIYFGDFEHYHYFPISGIRAVAVFTFDGEFSA